MGLTTESAHVFAPPASGITPETVAGAIREMMGGQPYREEAGAADRVIAVLPRLDAAWIPVFDTDFGDLDKRVKKLSQALSCYVAGVSVNDSDKFSLRLSKAGKAVDKLSGGVLRKKGSGKPEKWADVLTGGTVEDLAQSLEGGGIFAEEPLGHAVRALGLSPRDVMRTAEEVAGEPPEGAIVLRYRSLERREPEGPPRLVLASVQTQPGAVGQPLPLLMVQTANRGPAAKGVRVRIGGPAIDEGLIDVRGVRHVEIVSVGGGSMGKWTDFPVQRDGRGFFAELPELTIRTQIDPRSLTPGPGMIRAMKDYHRAVATFHFVSAALRAGAAEARVRIEWLSGEGEPVEAAVRVEVREA